MKKQLSAEVEIAGGMLIMQTTLRYTQRGGGPADAGSERRRGTRRPRWREVRYRCSNHASMPLRWFSFTLLPRAAARPRVLYCSARLEIKFRYESSSEDQRRSSDRARRGGGPARGGGRPACRGGCRGGGGTRLRDGAERTRVTAPACTEWRSGTKAGAGSGANRIISGQSAATFPTRLRSASVIDAHDSTAPASWI